VYVASLNGAVGYWDTGEAQTVPWIFGIMHPTGFPAFTLLGGAFAHVFAIGAVSWRIGVELEGHAWIALACALVFAFGEVTWTRGTRAEVHTLALFFALLAIWSAVRWYSTGSRCALIAGALAWGLGIATHPITALLLPAFLLLLLVRLRRTAWRSIALAVLALACGLALYAYLPARSAMVTAQQLDPTRSIGLAPGKSFWDTNHPSSWRGFVREVSGEQFPTRSALASMIDRDVYRAEAPGFFLLLLREITPLCALAALGGLFALLRRDRWLALGLLFAFAFPAAFAFAYSIEADRSRYYLISFAASLVLASYGASAVARALPVLRRTAAGILAAMAVVLFLLNRGTFAQPHSTGAQASITTVVEKTPRNAVLIAPWLFATPLAYSAYVDHALGNRIVVAAWLADEASHVPRWTRGRPVYVVGRLFGKVHGYRTVRIPGSPDLWKVVKK
jgi:4-amino-4-deoxy-L-arabinose transferase-like glycosyltransferase